MTSHSREKGLSLETRLKTKFSKNEYFQNYQAQNMDSAFFAL